MGFQEAPVLPVVGRIGEDLHKYFLASFPNPDNATIEAGEVIGTAVGHEAANSREVQYDIQRAGTTVIFYVMGSPDSVDLSSLLQGFAVSDPHPWGTNPPSGAEHLAPMYSPMYITNIHIVPWVVGEEAPDEGTNSTYKYAHAWSRVTLTYRQRCDPRGFEQHRRTALVSRGEWYTKKKVGGHVVATGLLGGDMRPIPVAHHVPIVTRRWPKVYLNASNIDAIDNAVSHLNKSTFLEKAPGVWMLDGADMDLLYRGPGDPPSTSAGYYEVTLVFRADIERKHEHWTPEPDEITKRPLLPAGPPTYSYYEDMHIRKTLHMPADAEFHLLVPG